MSAAAGGVLSGGGWWGWGGVCGGVVCVCVVVVVWGGGGGGRARTGGGRGGARARGRARGRAAGAMGHSVCRSHAVHPSHRCTQCKGFIRWRHACLTEPLCMPRWTSTPRGGCSVTPHPPPPTHTHTPAAPTLTRTRSHIARSCAAHSCSSVGGGTPTLGGSPSVSMHASCSRAQGAAGLGLGNRGADSCATVLGAGVAAATHLHFGAAGTRAGRGRACAGGAPARVLLQHCLDCHACRQQGGFWRAAGRGAGAAVALFLPARRDANWASGAHPRSRALSVGGERAITEWPHRPLLLQPAPAEHQCRRDYDV